MVGVFCHKLIFYSDKVVFLLTCVFHAPRLVFYVPILVSYASRVVCYIHILTLYAPRMVVSVPRFF